MCLYKFRILGEYLHSSHTYVKYKSDLHRKKLLYIWLESVFFQRNILLMKSFFFFLSLSDVYPGLILKSGAARRIAIAYNRMCARWGVRKSGENVYQHGTWPNRAIPNRHRVCMFFNWSADWRWRHAGLLSLSSPPSPAHKVSEPPGDSVLSLPDAAATMKGVSFLSSK